MAIDEPKAGDDDASAGKDDDGKKVAKRADVLEAAARLSGILSSTDTESIVAALNKVGFVALTQKNVTDSSEVYEVLDLDKDGLRTRVVAADELIKEFELGKRANVWSTEQSKVLLEVNKSILGDNRRDSVPDTEGRLKLGPEARNSYQRAKIYNAIADQLSDNIEQISSGLSDGDDPVLHNDGDGVTVTADSGDETMPSDMKSYVDAQDEVTRSEHRAQFAELKAHIEKSEAHMDVRISQINERFTGLDAQFSTLNAKLDMMPKPVSFWPMAGIAATTVIAIAGIILAALSLMSGSFNSGVSAMGAVEEAIDAERERNDLQNEILQNLVNRSAQQPGASGGQPTSP